jgi:2-methylcitrate dehydratase PrpD
MTMPAPIAPAGAATAPTLVLAQFAASLTGDALPHDIKVKLGELLLDYVRVASIGAGMPWSAWADSYMADLGGRGRAAVLFWPHRRDAVRAAFLNATYAGSIDADDTHVGSMLHPGSIVFSAALALADEVDAGGNDLIAALPLATRR